MGFIIKFTSTKMKIKLKPFFMKKITLGIAALFAAFTMNAQNTCADALAVTDGTYTVTGIDGEQAPTCFTNSQGQADGAANAEWYTYTAGTEDVVVTITSDLEVNAGGDTRLSVFGGGEDCTTFASCQASNDDVYFGGQDDPENNFLSTVEFIATAGETYYFVFDNRWSDEGFDFEISSTTEIPAVPGFASNPTPADGATVDLSDTGQVSETTGNPIYAYDFAWDAPTEGDEVTEYIYLIGTTPTVSEMQPITLGATPSATITGLQLETQYYWAIYPTNVSGGPETENLPVWSFTTSGNLSIDKNIQKENKLTHYNTNEQLTIESASQLETVNLYSILGTQVHTQKLNNRTANINISQLQAGVYLAQVQVEGKTKTFKFVKK